MSIQKNIGPVREGAMPPSLAARMSNDQHVCVFDNFAAVETAWRHLESRAVFTPYQRFEWMAAVHANGLDQGQLAIAVLGPPDQPVALLPLVIVRRAGLRQAGLVGSHAANGDWLMADRESISELTLPVLQRFFVKIARQTGGIDIMRLRQLPARWDGHANPLLAFAHQNAPNNLYMAEIGAIASPFIAHGIASKLRSNLRRGRARLEEQFGPVSVRRITDAHALSAVHATFLLQRGERFAQMGIDNIFATPEMVGLFTTLASAGLGADRPAMLAHALYAGDTILATSFGIMGGSHFSQYINSTSTGPASKYSLMGILMVEMMDDLIASGIQSFDMGTGDFAYKTDWTAPQTVFDSAVALSWRGALALPVLDGLVSAKRAIKQNPHAWALARLVQKLGYDLKIRLGR